MLVEVVSAMSKNVEGQTTDINIDKPTGINIIALSQLVMLERKG